MSESTENPRDKLVDDLSAVLGEAEEMLKRAAVETGEKARDLRSQVETKLLRAKLRLQEIEGEAVDRAKAAARATDDYVHDQSVAGDRHRRGPRRRDRPAAEPPLVTRGGERQHARRNCGTGCAPRSRGWALRWSASCTRGSSWRRSSSGRSARGRRPT